MKESDLAEGKADPTTKTGGKGTGYTVGAVGGKGVGMGPRLPIGMKLLVAFFVFGTCACTVTVAALLLPGSWLDVVWRVNPEARVGFQESGRPLSVLLMFVVGSACAMAALGLALRKVWGRWLAIGILVVNLAGDTINALARHDPRTLIGLPVAGLMIWYLGRSKKEKG